MDNVIRIVPTAAEKAKEEHRHRLLRDFWPEMSAHGLGNWKRQETMTSPFWENAIRVLEEDR